MNADRTCAWTLVTLRNPNHAGRSASALPAGISDMSPPAMEGGDTKIRDNDRRSIERMRSNTDRRSSYDRSSYDNTSKAPREISGCIKETVERSRTPDRCLIGIDVAWLVDEQQSCA
jgi:hypothetical protein